MSFRIKGVEIISAKFWKQLAGDVSSRCRVLYRLRKRNIYKSFLSETFISFTITIFLKFAEIWESEYCSYCFLKKSLIEDCFILSSLLWFILFETFRSRESRSKFVVNSINLFRISIASSTSFRNGGDMGLSGTWFWSLLPSSMVSTGCVRYSLTISTTDNDQDSLVATSIKINDSICI